ncbi:MAG: hypothetical protein WCQ20_03665 [Synechococcaceae cyanobacterium ELA739]
MHMVANFWPGATASQLHHELAALHNDQQLQEGYLFRSVAEVEGGLLIVGVWSDRDAYERYATEQMFLQIDKPGGMEGRPIQQAGSIIALQSSLPCC